MSQTGAKGLASGILHLIGFIIKLFRSDKKFVEPTTRERDELAEVLIEFAYRRAGWLSAVDDLYGLAFIVGAYATRAVRTPAEKKEDAAEQPA